MEQSPLTKEYFDQGLAKLETTLTKQNEQLAASVKKGFDAVDKRFDGVSKEFEGVNKKLQDLEIGQEDIKLRLDQAAWKFETDALDRRVKVLEDKAGIVREKR